MPRWSLLAVALGGIALALSPGLAGAQTPAPIDPRDFSATLTNRFYPLSTLQTLTYEGEEKDPDTGETMKMRGVTTTLAETATIDGTTVLVLKDENFANGELVESTRDYFAQHVDGSVYYFGEDVDNYRKGVVASHHGSWRAGEGQNLPGIFMPAEPVVGQRFDQERAPGIAEDQSTVLATNISLTTRAGAFSGCIETEDFNPLDKLTENKWYCPGVGFVREESGGEVFELVGYTLAAAPATATPAAAATPRGDGARPIVAPATGLGPDGSSHNGAAAWLAAALGASAAAAMAMAAVTGRRVHSRQMR